MEDLLRVEGLKKYFPVKHFRGLRTEIQQLKAVNDVSFSVKKHEILGLVGESGCGKSTLGRTILKLYEPTGGKIVYDGSDITGLSDAEMKSYRTKMQMIFQDPYASLDPRMTVGDIIAEPMTIQKKYTQQEIDDKVQELIEVVGLKPDHVRRYPHEFSGGQRQRVGTARALAADPDFIICDEPISALDVSIQAQIVNMLEELQEKRGLAYLFIAHDLSMVRHISDRIGVMYLGRLVEIGRANDIYYHAMHPYSQALLSAVPIPDPDVEKKHQRIVVEGEVPNPIGIGDCCPFCTRCRYAKKECHEHMPELKEVDGRKIACVLYE